ncbi:MAG TPA: FkbM family methyltransferase [Crocinitomicaceae bacterium]|nr:FkbM family methyltransferase [Crocinitomicaceae bacterium]
MIAFIKKILFKLMSQQAYLKTLHRGFYFMYNLGLLKKDERFKYHYLIQDIIEDDYTVVDIGANLGYFSKNFAKLTPRGKVLSIEPVKPFFDVLSSFMKKYKYAEVVNYALGNESGTITMVMPESNGMIRTGLPHIAESEEEKKQHKTHEVEIVKGSELLSTFDKIDYIKCDIEGYELVVFNEIKKVVAEMKPIVQIEIGPDNEKAMFDYFDSLDYAQYGVADFKFVKESRTQKEQGDFLFVHSSQVDDFEQRMKAKGKY